MKKLAYVSNTCGYAIELVSLEVKLDKPISGMCKCSVKLVKYIKYRVHILLISHKDVSIFIKTTNKLC